MIAHVFDHAARALARLLEQYKGKPRISALASAVGAQAQGVEDALAGLQDATSLAASEGAQLDTLGRIVGVDRGSADDAYYRSLLRAKVRFNKSNGTSPDLLAIFRLIAPPASTLTLVEYAPASFVLYVAGTLSTSADVDAYRFFLAARAAGVRGFVQYSLVAPGDTFTLDAGPGLDVGHLAGDVT